MIAIQESDMNFGDFDDGCVFQIEKSDVYGSISEHGVKTCEFILLKENKLLFVEAKTSCPNYFMASSSEEKKNNYDTYVSDIVQKMRDSLDLYASMLLFRRDRSEIPDTLIRGVNGDRSIILILVVKTAEQKWLVPFPDVFKKKLEKEMKIWNIDNFLVINEEMARRKGLVKESPGTKVGESLSVHDRNYNEAEMKAWL